MRKQFAGASWLWLGANGDANRTWRWAEGPEKEDVFWQRGKTNSAFTDWIEYTEIRKEQGRIKDEPNEKTKAPHYFGWSPGPNFPDRDTYFRQERDRGTRMDHDSERAINGILVEYSMPPQ